MEITGYLEIGSDAENVEVSGMLKKKIKVKLNVSIVIARKSIMWEKN